MDAGGVTEVGQVVEATFGNCGGHGCSKVNVVYREPMEQILSLINASEECWQSITFHCFDSPLRVYSHHLGWWLDRNGLERF